MLIPVKLEKVGVSVRSTFFSKKKSQTRISKRQRMLEKLEFGFKFTFDTRSLLQLATKCALLAVSSINLQNLINHRDDYIFTKKKLDSLIEVNGLRFFYMFELWTG